MLLKMLKNKKNIANISARKNNQVKRINLNSENIYTVSQV
jgi:hypothetical protein